MSHNPPDESDRDGDYVRMHRDSAYAKELGDRISIRCPHCDNWNDSEEVMIDGCECGAEAKMWMKFE